jgi:hypothetical protein
VIIWSDSSYRDGGTMEFTVSYSKYVENIKICVDKRISSALQGSVWLGYPGKGRLLTDDEVDEFRRALDVYNQRNMNTYLECIRLFNEFGYRPPTM